MSLKSITIPGKETVAIVAHLWSAGSDIEPKRLVIFLNGMVAPQASWHQVISSIQATLPTDSPISFLTYDRFASGLTKDKDPIQADAEFGNDLNSVVDDLHAILAQTTSDSTRLILVGNSIGCAIARQYTARYPGKVAGVLLLDSILANNDQQDDLIPNPSSPEFDPATLPPGLTVDDLTRSRTAFHVYSPDIPNRQGFDRRNMHQILPYANQPKLEGVDGRPPKVIVVGHDPAYFIQDSAVRMQISEVGLRNYVQPVWERYNEGLTQLGDCEEGVKIAQGAGHFVQVDKPQFVADEISKLLKSVEWA